MISASRMTSVDLIGGTRPAPAEPSAKPGRLIGVDAVRGAALLGMIAVHSMHEADAAGRPTWSYTVFSGRAAAAFAVLAGVGIAFMTGRRRVRSRDGSGTVAALAVRALAIGALGLALAEVDTVLEAVVLAYLAVAFGLAIPLVFLPTWAVAVIGVTMATAVPALTYVLLPHLPEPILDNPTVGYLVDDPGGLLSELTITGLYPALPWLAYVCAGLVVGRLTLTRVQTAVGLLVTGAALAVVASSASTILLTRYGGLARIWAAQPDSGWTAEETTQLLAFGGDGSTPTSTWWWLAVDAPHTSTPVNLVSTTGVALAALGLLLLVGHVTRPVLRVLIGMVRTPLATIGAMTLTFYTAHILFLNSSYDTYDATTGFVVQVGVALLVGSAWRATGGRGPLEALVSALANLARRRARTVSRRRASEYASGRL